MFLTESDEVEQAVLSKNTLTVLHLNCSVYCYLCARGIYLKAAHPVTLSGFLLG